MPPRLSLFEKCIAAALFYCAALMLVAIQSQRMESKHLDAYERGTRFALACSIAHATSTTNQAVNLGSRTEDGGRRGS